MKIMNQKIMNAKKTLFANKEEAHRYPERERVFLAGNEWNNYAIWQRPINVEDTIYLGNAHFTVEDFEKLNEKNEWERAFKQLELIGVSQVDEFHLLLTHDKGVQVGYWDKEEKIFFVKHLPSLRVELFYLVKHLHQEVIIEVHGVVNEK